MSVTLVKPIAKDLEHFRAALLATLNGTADSSVYFDAAIIVRNAEAAGKLKRGTVNSIRDRILRATLTS